MSVGIQSYTSNGKHVSYPEKREIMFENQGWREKRYSNYLLIIVCNQRVEIVFLHVYNMLHCSD